jgi:Phosphotransferase enzyme family
MSNDDKVLLEEKLIGLFPDQFTRLIEPWDQCDWSKSYKAEFVARDALYVKGTPRNRAEAHVTSVLHRYCPNHIPDILEEDLLPENQWRWFLLENVGECDHAGITPECAVDAAFHMGRLQSIICRDMQLAKYLPQCQADRLQEALSSVCEWALQTASADMRNDLLPLHVKIIRSTNFFYALQKKLSHLSSTCVHGDFWSGNIACREDKISFIDWGDTLWGVGSISIVNLLSSAAGELSNHVDEIWDAYSSGREKYVTEDFIQGSQVAALIGSLIIDVEIAKCCNGTVEMLPGLFPILQRLTNLWM